MSHRLLFIYHIRFYSLFLLLVPTITKCHTNNPLKSIAALTSGFMGTIVGAHATNKLINRFAFHSNSTSPVMNDKTSPDPSNILTENNSVNSSKSNCNHKPLLVDTLSPPQDDFTGGPLCPRQDVLYLTLWIQGVSAIFTQPPRAPQGPCTGSV